MSVWTQPGTCPAPPPAPELLATTQVGDSETPHWRSSWQSRWVKAGATDEDHFPVFQPLPFRRGTKGVYARGLGGPAFVRFQARDGTAKLGLRMPEHTLRGTAMSQRFDESIRLTLHQSKLLPRIDAHVPRHANLEKDKKQGVAPLAHPCSSSSCGKIFDILPESSGRTLCVCACVCVFLNSQVLITDNTVGWFPQSSINSLLLFFFFIFKLQQWQVHVHLPS